MLIAVINLGLKSIRCIIFDEAGRKLATASRPVHTYLRSREVEQDATEWLRLLEEVSREAAAGVGGGRVEAVAISASASCLVAVDADGRPTFPVMMVSDSRCVREVEELRNHPRFQEVAEATGMGVTADLMLAKILWLRKHRPDVFERTRFFMSPADFLGYHLTGRAVIDANNASKFHALPDGSGRLQYEPGLLDVVGISEEQLPAIEPIGSIIGEVSRVAGERYGLPPGASVVLATYDAICAVVGSGVARVGTAAAVSGTVTSVRTLVAAPPARRPNGVHLSRWVEEEAGLAVIGGSNNLGGGLVEWHKQAFYYDTPDDPYDLMDTEARTIPPGAEGLVFLPYLLGERAPVWDSDARGVFFGLDRRHTRAHFTRSVLESAAFSTRHILEHIQAASACIDGLRFSGGMSRIPVVGEVLADVLQMPIAVPAEFETTSLGAMIIAGTALGRYRSVAEACDAVVAIERVHEPDPAVAELYAAMFELYKDIYQRTRALQNARSELLARFPEFLDAAVATRENL